MKLRLLVLLAVFCCTASNVFGYRFKSGDLYYSTTSDSTVAVTYQYSKKSSSSNYSGLVSATIPESVTYEGTTYRVTSIGREAFNSCMGLTSVTIPHSVTSIGREAFWCCISLTSVAVPNSVTTIGENAFQFVANIVYSGTATGSPWGARSVNGYVDGYFVYSDATKTTLLACSDAATGTITIPNSVTSIGAQAFHGCTGLTSITIPNSVTTIGYWAFSACFGLTSITIPNSVTSIGKGAFVSCKSLISIKVESGNAVYDSRNNCNAIIETATNTLVAGCMNTIIPNSVTSIGYDAFSGCTSLTSITIPNSVTTIGDLAFYGCTGLTSITIPNSVTSIGDWAFSGCTGLTSITIPNSVTAIGDYAFKGCTGLTSITIPNSVTSVGGWAFSGCTGLTSVTCYATEPPTVEYNSFLGVYVFTPLYVPEESVEKYKAAEVWKHFKEILPIQNTAIDQPTLNPIGNSTQSRKVFRDGQVLILRGDKTYTVEGRQF